MAGFAPEVLDLMRRQGGGIEGSLGHLVPYHVRKPADGGSDSNHGRSWAKAFANIQTGLDAVATLGGRGRGMVLVGPGGYTEDLSTPTNTEAPFGMLLGVSPGGVSRGGVYLQALTAGRAALKILARGWKVSGFEIDALADAGCIDLDSVAGNASYAEIIGNLLCGTNQGLYGIDYMGNAPLTTIRDNDIFGFKSNAGKGAHVAATNNGTGIIQSNVTADVARFAKILENRFWDNENHIWQKGGGFKESVIRGNDWLRWGGNQYARRILEIVQANEDWHNNVIEDNHGEGFQGDIICQQKIATIPANDSLDIFTIVGGSIEVIDLGWECIDLAVAGAGNHQFAYTDHAAAATNLCTATALAAARIGEVAFVNGDVTDALQVLASGILEMASTVATRLILERGGTIAFSTTGAGATGTLRFFIRYRKKGQSAFVNIA